MPPFTKFITKIDGIAIDDAKGLDLVMQIHNLIKYSSNCSETTGSLCFYAKDEATDSSADTANNFKSFKYKANLLGNAEPQPNPNNANEILKKIQ